MKALQYNRYGGPELLQWNEIPIPEPSAREVLVKVKAASLNPTDSKLRAGQLHFGSDILPRTMGMDFAGIVAGTGIAVAGLKKGDRVAGYLGIKGGGIADFAIAEVQNTILIPWNISFEEAACLPMNAATALKITTDYLQPAPGEKLLVNGASGGIGSFIVQYAENAGAIVFATAGTKEGLDILRALGVREAINYKTTDILKSRIKFDSIIDTSGKLDFNEAKNILSEEGLFIAMAPGIPAIPGRTDGAKTEKIMFASPGPEEFRAVQQMAADGRIKALVSEAFPMTDAVAVIEQFESGQLEVTGKIVLSDSIGWQSMPLVPDRLFPD